ncbi:MAG TPA: 1-(5-phosphoribosyl)-5-[(5-phosphoribosylamino)methylideneamino]imidazole-4-carboxamide isomerase [Bacillales bacterium]|nr:1-(5-phosphoribosyl)-5-[(5-phosphoribosylamino)methylideneamino]imidazole-4-carboxamide isomerase [Bacillales bacterium]
MSPFTIYPAIDIRGGKCVRLLQGDYNKETVYADSPFAVAERFQQQGAKWIHMVDLDGAKKGTPVNAEHVVHVKNDLGVKVEIGGGIRTKEDVARYLEAGVDRVILGSSAISEPAFVKDMLSSYGSRIAIGIDARDGYVAVEGWTKTSKVKADELALQLIRHGAETFIFTDISKDGTLAGPNVTAISELARVTGKEVIASGGVSSLADLKALHAHSDAGISGAIVGRALYTKAFTVAEALKAVGARC